MKRDSTWKTKRAGRILFILYLACLIYFLFFSENYGRTDIYGEYRYNLVLFREIRRFIIYRRVLGMPAVLINLAGNVAAFIPLGVFLPQLSEKTGSFLRILLISLAVSLAVETLQLISRVGCFDVDDLLLNTLGGCLGYLIYVFFGHIRRKRHGGKTDI